MSEVISRAFLYVAESCGHLNSSLVGEAYLLSPDKQFLDYYGTNILTPVWAPFIAAARLAVLVESGSPTVIHLPRIGKDGAMFRQHKIRSMTKGTENLTERINLKICGDPLITKVGKIIRKLSFDELTQIKNVRDQEMSLVGPRPLSATEFKEYCNFDGFEEAYTITLPGLTGLVQINGRENLSPAQRREYIQQYSEEACLKLDTDIIQKTARQLLSSVGAY
jgi:lipopolysaccharide/colanic/teichoic acid biosynthesis glycosyltransferase